jgi:Ser/Thr protein kinase RdoA (MazF antagonist)
LLLADGRRAFLKGCSPGASEFMRAAFARELRVYQELHELIREWSPSVYGYFARDDWDILILEDLGPKSVPPWTASITRPIVQSFAKFHAANRGVALPDWLRRPSEWLKDPGLLWNWTNNRSSRVERAAVAGNLAAEAAEWFARNGPLLRSVSSTHLTTPAPPQLLHTDARSDNLRWKNGRLYLVDWAEAVAGPPELDAAFFIQSIAVESPLDPETILEWYRQIHPLDPEVMEAAICAAAAFFADRAWLPEQPGLPRLRTFQRRQLHVTLGWALRRLGLETPTWLAAVGGGAADAR